MPWLRRHCQQLHFDTLQVEMKCLTTARCILVALFENNLSDTDNESDNTTDPSHTVVIDMPNEDPFFGHPEQ